MKKKKKKKREGWISWLPWKLWTTANKIQIKHKDDQLLERLYLASLHWERFSHVLLAVKMTKIKLSSTDIREKQMAKGSNTSSIRLICIKSSQIFAITWSKTKLLLSVSDHHKNHLGRYVCTELTNCRLYIKVRFTGDLQIK